MTTYKMPEVLGGGELEAIEQWGGCAGGRPEYLIGGITVTMPPGQPLERVKPPLPEEPPVGDVVRADFKADDRTDIESWVFEHAEIPAPNGNSWYGAGRDEAFSWADICALGTPVRLIPAPEPVELPWSYDDEHSNSSVAIQPAGNPYMVEIAAKEEADGGTTYVYVPVAQLLRAVWAAAAEAEATS